MSSYYTYEGNLRDRNKFTSTVNTDFGVKRYFSSLDTEVYFGAKQVDEIVAIDFAISEPKLPIYGFNSFYANRIVSGRRTIQGTFAINFTGVFYLLNILNEIDDSVLKATYTPTGSDTALDYESLIGRCEGDDSTGLGIGNSAIFRKIFDITLSYGYGKSENKSFNGCYQTLVGVQIVDYRQALDTEGNPILDMYSFIAKDLRYSDALTEEENPNTEDTQPPDNGGEGGEKEDKYTYTPTFSFHYPAPGHHTASVPPYLKITMETDDPAEELTDVFISITNAPEGSSSLAISIDKLKKGEAYLFDFEESYREFGLALRDAYAYTEGYTAKCNMSFTTKNKNGEVVNEVLDGEFDITGSQIN